MSYQRYVDFYISETDGYRLDLPDKVPLQAAACVWRIVILPPSTTSPTTMTTSSASLLSSSKALIACLRIDSYFNPSIVAGVQAAVNVRSIQISFYNHLRPNYYASLSSSLPTPLDRFELNGMIPDEQCFALLEYKDANFVVEKWPGSLLLNLTARVSVNVLDYALLIMQEVLDSVDVKVQWSSKAVDDYDDCDYANDPPGSNNGLAVSCDCFSLKMSPSVFHTLSVSTHLWNNLINDKNSMVLTTRYIIANDTNIPVRFGQAATDDNILLESRQCHFYSWRHTTNQLLRIAIDESGGWSWSKPFLVNSDGSYVAEFTSSSRSSSSSTSSSPSDIFVGVNVSSLSASQKLVKFSGQLVVSNQLVDCFEMKLVKYDDAKDLNGKSSPLALSRDSFSIPSSPESACSIVLTENCHVAMRLRFSSIPNLSWTGDIPLQPNARWGQPWLVKGKSPSFVIIN